MLRVMPSFSSFVFWALSLWLPAVALAAGPDVPPDESCRMAEIPAADFTPVADPFKIKLKNGFEFYLSPVAPNSVAETFSTFDQENKAKFFKKRKRVDKDGKRVNEQNGWMDEWMSG